MIETLIGIAIGAGVALLLVWVWRARGGSGIRVDVHHSIEGMRAVGELVVFRLITQQIVTAEQHIAGRYKDFFKWLVSTQKLAVIIEYGIDFKYNLRDSRFSIQAQEDGTIRLMMPPCDYQAHIRDIKFYDERNARVLPWLLGDMTEALGPGFKEADKNKLLDAARAEADAKARTYVEQLQTEAQSSARQTLEYMARGFGVERIVVDFTHSVVGTAKPTTLETPAPVAVR